jgi:hypothetical protein
MKNKKLIYGLLGVGAVLGFYFWNKNKTMKTSKSSNLVRPEEKPTTETYSSVTGGGTYVLGCNVCQRKNGTTYFAQGGMCVGGDSCFSSKRRLTSN